MNASFLLYVIAIICLFCAAFGIPARRISLGWLGLALWLLGATVGGVWLR